MDLKYTKHEVISLKEHFDEKWLQNRIEEDPSILGLGDLTVIERERKQLSGGRIDFLLLDPETDTMYETEIQLGEVDESHIIRTIEYWDIERRRFQSKEHFAVIVAEDITNRFFNVINLMNRSIPIIALQLNAIKVGDSVLLTFTKVLDVYQEPEDEEALPGELVDRSFWEKKSNSKSLELMDKIISVLQQTDSGIRVTYNKHHVAVGTERRNFCWFHPRKREGYCHFEIRVGEANLENAKDSLEGAGIPFNHRREDLLAMSLHWKTFEANRELLSKRFVSAWEAYH